MHNLYNITVATPQDTSERYHVRSECGKATRSRDEHVVWLTSCSGNAFFYSIEIGTSDTLNIVINETGYTLNPNLVKQLMLHLSLAYNINIKYVNVILIGSARDSQYLHWKSELNEVISLKIPWLKIVTVITFFFIPIMKKLLYLIVSIPNKIIRKIYGTT